MNNLLKVQDSINQSDGWVGALSSLFALVDLHLAPTECIYQNKTECVKIFNIIASLYE